MCKILIVAKPIHDKTYNQFKEKFLASIPSHGPKEWKLVECINLEGSDRKDTEGYHHNDPS